MNIWFKRGIKSFRHCIVFSIWKVPFESFDFYAKQMLRRSIFDWFWSTFDQIWSSGVFYTQKLRGKKTNKHIIVFRIRNFKRCAFKYFLSFKLHLKLTKMIEKQAYNANFCAYKLSVKHCQIQNFHASNFQSLKTTQCSIIWISFFKSNFYLPSNFPNLLFHLAYKWCE